MLAKKQTMVILCLALLTAALLASTCFAEEDEAVILQGTVSVTKEADVIKSIQLNTDSDVYNVELDENGLMLGEMEGLTVEVEGTVTEKDDQKVLEVWSFSEVESENKIND